MRRLFQLACVLLLAARLSFALPAGCGTGTDQSTCGNVGGSFSTVGQTPLSACNLSLGAGSYYLTQDVTATPYSTNTAAQSACFSLAGTGITLNLNGHTVTGGIYANSTAQDAEIYNGSVTHDIGYDQQIAAGMYSYAGIYFTGLGCPASSPLRLHHLTVTSGVDADFNLFVSSGPPASQCSVNPTVQIYNITSTAPANTTSSRTANFYLLGSSAGYDPFEVYYNNLTCPATSSSCQGIALYNIANSLVHNNYINLVANTLLPESSYPNNSFGRGIILDGGEAVSGTYTSPLNVIGSAGAQAYNNTVIANNNRCFRTRNSINTTWNNNQCLSVLDPSNSTNAHCFHIGDPDNGDNDLQGLTVTNNQCDLGPGRSGIYFLRAWSSTNGILFSGNTYTCNAGGCTGAWGGGAVQPQGNGTRSIITLNNENASAIPGQAGTGDKFTAQNERTAATSGNLVNDTVSLTYCNVGTVGIDSSLLGLTPTITQSCGGSTYTLSTATAGTGSGTVSCSPSGSGISSGTAYSCTVSASGGSTLATVSGCGGSGTTTFTGNMPASNCTVTATFNPSGSMPPPNRGSNNRAGVYR
jgi:hypothetical protein